MGTQDLDTTWQKNWVENMWLPETEMVMGQKADPVSCVNPTCIQEGGKVR
jgi:hypothetical protein